MASVFVQAGGQSQRMGTNKALVPFLGEPLIQRVIRRVRPLAREIVIVTNDPQPYLELGYPIVADRIPGLGALGGLYTALSYARHPYVIVIACDMPFVNSSLLLEAQNRLVQGGWDAVLPQSGEGLEPFHAVYRRDTCLPAVERALKRGERRMISWLPEVRWQAISWEEVKVIDPQGVAFMNVNTPEELANAEDLARTVYLE
ncbi:molybdenum cofactor guanylyltransferase [Thermanaerothrix sp. 4228-RoL]|jgi:molybdopterin-guanine dinucleotide biosynthesis protein A|uniref:Probable molybdenum cofactor guanylyltransferase n=2 Tax=Anaerolineaceae TaxID=292628 RepID=A0ABU3NKP9_9CHLR|nr:molybdenum cofactor guanylyltransferase [Thermanaerothrix sp. 4228-RoL]MDT8897424.1 molybdenum cofactor guanylyltransferase [Thermanaerothrix sp. 4228-RoL]